MARASDSRHAYCGARASATQTFGFDPGHRADRDVDAPREIDSDIVTACAERRHQPGKRGGEIKRLARVADAFFAEKCRAFGR
jgi:hypothetical protein